MSQSANHGLVNLLPRTLIGAGAALTFVVLLVLLPAGYTAYGKSGATGLVAATAAAVVCWLGSMIALVLTRRFQGTANPLAGVFGAILFRTGFPLLAAVALSATSRTLAAAGIFGLILVFYLPTLAAETFLSVRLVNSARKEPKAL